MSVSYCTTCGGDLSTRLVKGRIRTGHADTAHDDHAITVFDVLADPVIVPPHL